MGVDLHVADHRQPLDVHTASSKSLAVSPSMVTSGMSRRSTRPR
jgi:hypothetical protein